MSEIRLFEAFAGIGSQHTALSNLQKKYDFKLIQAGMSEWDVHAVLSYMNLNNIERDNSTDNMSVQELQEFMEDKEYSLDGKEIAKSLSSLPDKYILDLFYSHFKLKNEPNIQNLTGKKLYDSKCNLFTYSFPCQDLSQAGKGQGMKKGSKTRSGLLWEVERVLDELSDIDKNSLPKYLLLENVPQIVNVKHKHDYEEWKAYLSSKGYTTFDGIINSLDVNLPQSRKRFFAISIFNYEGKISNKNSIFDIIKYFKNNEFTKRKTVYTIVKTEKDFNNEKMGNIYFNEALDATPNHTKSRLKLFETEKKLTNDDGNVPRKPAHKHYANTLTTKQDRWGNAGIVIFKMKIFSDNSRSKFRYITPREALMFQGFDEKNVSKLISYGIPRNRVYAQAGNSIAVPVLEEIFETFILSDFMETNEDLN